MTREIRKDLIGLQFFTAENANAQISTENGKQITTAEYLVRKGLTPSSVKVGDRVNLDGQAAIVVSLSNSGSGNTLKDLWKVKFRSE